MRSCKQLDYSFSGTIIGSESLSDKEKKALESRYRFGFCRSIMGIDSTFHMNSGRRLINAEIPCVDY